MTCHRPPHQRGSSTTSAASNSNSSTNGDECYRREVVDKKSPTRKLPHWVKANIREWEGVRICMPEWDEDESIATDDEDNEVGAENGDNCRIIDRDRMTEYEFNDDYRKRNGWMGTDLCHSARYSPVRISHYTVKYSNKHHNHQQGGGGVGTTLTGLCHYTQQSESHAGYCHGGSMTAAIDDVVGWTAFNVLGKCEPWSGYTVQVNVALKRPIPVGSYLKIVGEITKFEGRKVWVHAKLVVPDDDEDGEDKEVLHCDAEGLVLLKKDVVTSSPIFHTP